MFQIKRTWLLVMWIAFGIAILALDYLTGPNIAISYLFLIPVVLAAHYNGRLFGLALAIILPLTRFCFYFAWNDPHSFWDSVLNAVIRIGILTGAAYLIDRTRRQAQEIRVLRGILPICMYCKKIRTPEQRWHSLEGYITEHSEAKFSHTFCPECGKKYYADYLLSDDERVSMKPPEPPVSS
ncbi:MAG TPA: DUF4118 domain-containing protein, partial [Verrucomicrobiae bacterium]|nr:DUF4118 domain-containing protein [Verrucomicrobiae bacterium]